MDKLEMWAKEFAQLARDADDDSAEYFTAAANDMRALSTERDQLRAEKKESAQEAVRLAEEAGRLKALLHDAQRDAEKWRSIDGFEGYYEVSSFGRVRSVDRTDSDGNRRKGQHLVPSRKGKGYLSVALSRAGVPSEHYVHRLVAGCFIPNPKEMPQVNHIDGDPANNAVENLEWVSNAENQTHARRILARGVRAVFCISEDGQRHDFPSIQHAVEAGFVRANIQKCIAGLRKKHGGCTWHDAAMAAEREVQG